MVSSPPSNCVSNDLLALIARRVVVLGASNVTRGIAPLVETAGHIWGRPTDFLIAAGYGRSYGKTSRVMARRLPSILSCGLWEAWKQRASLPTAALVTDIGNDILYGASVTEIVGWVTECLERLASRCERIVLTALPIASVSELDEHRFVIMRSLLFPKSTLQLNQALIKATELNQAVSDLALRFQAKIVHTERHWYGLDPIHVRRRYVPIAWRKVLNAWCDEPREFELQSSWRRWWQLRRQRPFVREFFGVMQHTSQPSVCLNDGTLVSLF